jgi:hypothetical protein
MPRAKTTDGTATLANGDPRPEGLYAKVAYVMGQVQHVPKNGYNAHFKYEYVREIDLTEHLRPLLAEIGLVVFPSATDRMQIVGEGKNQVTYVYHHFKFVDAETGDAEVVGVWGAGQDGQDKGPYKALTGAEKYALMKTFMVPTGDDPEATDGGGEPTGNTRPQKVAPPAKAARPTPAPTPAPSEDPEEPEDDPAPAPAPAKPAKPAKGKAPAEDELLERQIQGAQNAIRDAATTLREEYELGDEEQSNLEAALELVDIAMEDRTRYLKALVRAKTYLEGLMEE